MPSALGRPFARVALASLLLALLLLACSGKTTQAGLELVLATNLSAPQDFDAVHLEVSQETTPGQWKSVLARSWTVPGQTSLPTTFSIAAGTAPDQDVRLRFVALKAGAPVVLREAQVQVPNNRVAELTLILSAACLGQVAVDPSTGEAVPTCTSPGQSCQPATGQCGSDVVDPGSLPAYVPGSEETVDAGPRDATVPPPPDAAPPEAGVDATVADAGPDSSLPTLLSLTPSLGALTPAFAPDALSYAVQIADAFGFDAFTLTATFDPSETVTVNGVAVASGAASTTISVPLGGPTPVDVAVTGAGGTQHYSVAVTNAPSYTQIVAPTQSPVADFGDSISIDGDTLVVGAGGENGVIDGGVTWGVGAVYVYTRSATSWALQQRIAPPNPQGNAFFGDNLVVSGDTLVVAASQESGGSGGVFPAPPNPNDTSAPNCGAAYVYARTSGVWSLQAYIKPTNGAANWYFGDGLAFTGNAIYVGAPGEASGNGDAGDTTVPYAGAVYVFTRSGATWAQTGYVKAQTIGYSLFGVRVAVSANTMAVAAPWEESLSTGVNGNPIPDAGRTNAGAAYVFVNDGGTSPWTQQAYVKASNTAPNAYFGGTVDISGDTLVVGDPWESSASTGVNGDQTPSDAGFGSGATYVFTRSGGVWSQQAYLKPSTNVRTGNFGQPAVLSGSLLFVAEESDPSLSGGFNGDQTPSPDAGDYAGAVYVFRQSGGAWKQEDYVKSPVARPYDFFGSAISVSGDQVAIGAMYPNYVSGADAAAWDGSYAGATYVIH